jgi:1-acyl-sn-glycerol-3-phosphate acyltransferase
LLYWFLKFIALGPPLRVIFRPKTSGLEHVPETGPAILASNHLSYSDWLFMPLQVRRRVTFVAKAEYFTEPGFKGWLKRKFFSGAGQVPIDRSGAYRISYPGGRFNAQPEIIQELIDHKSIQVIEEKSGSLIIGVTIRGFDYYARHLSTD